MPLSLYIHISLLILIYPNVQVPRCTLLRHCVESGAIGDLSESMYIDIHERYVKERVMARARVLGNEWSMGIRAFDGLAEPGDVGIFPDEQGMFHHDMVVREQEEISVGLDPEACQHK